MLRDYQIDICSRVSEAFDKHRSVMVQMPTGTGKTIVLASLVIKILINERIKGRSGRILIVAHRRELIEQIKATITRMGLNANNHSSLINNQTIIVESIQTISRRIGNPPTGGQGDLAFSLVVIDEAHHAIAKTYKMMWEAWPEARFLGLTATPWRMSGEGFTDLFEVLVQSWSIKNFIGEGWLCPFDYFSLRPDSEDLKRVESLTKRGSDGDYLTKEMREKLDDAPCIERLFDAYKRHADGKKGIVYAIDIEHAEHIAEYYRLHGVAAVAVSSKTQVKERKEIIERFRSTAGGQLLVSVDLFSEGFDCPDVEFIQIARPTLSLAKYLQMVGRGLRTHKGKVCCTIIDHVGLYRAFGLPSANSDWYAAFCGLKNERIKELKFLDFHGGWIASSLMEDKGEDVVKIVSHEGMADRYKGDENEGFEMLRNEKGKTVWMDKVNGVTFDSRPMVMDFSGLELSTDDGILFYPRIASRLIDNDCGIHINLLMMQVGDGILWKKRYVSLGNPTKVYLLEETLPNGMRVFKDGNGEVFLQQAPDHPLVAEKVVDRNQMICRSNEMVWKIDRINSERDERHKGTWDSKYPVQKVVENIPDLWLQKVRFYNINSKPKTEAWVDMKTSYVYEEKPEIFRRGCVELARVDGVVYVRNIPYLHGYAYMNHAVRADERLSVIGNHLSLWKDSACHSYTIKKKSEDLTMFIAEEIKSTYMIVNKPGKDLEVKYWSMEGREHQKFIEAKDKKDNSASAKDEGAINNQQSAINNQAFNYESRTRVKSTLSGMDVKVTERRIVDGQGEEIVPWNETLVMTHDGFARWTDPNKGTCYLDMKTLKLYKIRKANGKRPQVQRYGWLEFVIFGNAIDTREKNIVRVNDMKCVSSVGMCMLLNDSRRVEGDVVDNAKRTYCYLKGDDGLFSLAGRYYDDTLLVKDMEGVYHLILAKKGEKVFCGQMNYKALEDYEVRLKQWSDIEEQKAQRRKTEERDAVIGMIEPYEHLKLWGLKCGDKIIIPAQFRRVKKPVGSYFAFEKYAMQWGVMDIHGKMIVEPKYKDVNINEDGTAELTIYGEGKMIKRLMIDE